MIDKVMEARGQLETRLVELLMQHGPAIDTIAWQDIVEEVVDRSTVERIVRLEDTIVLVELEAGDGDTSQ